MVAVPPGGSPLPEGIGADRDGPDRHNPPVPRARSRGGPALRLDIAAATDRRSDPAAAAPPAHGQHATFAGAERSEKRHFGFGLLRRIYSGDVQCFHLHGAG